MNSAYVRNPVFNPANPQLVFDRFRLMSENIVSHAVAGDDGEYIDIALVDITGFVDYLYRLGYNSTGARVIVEKFGSADALQKALIPKPAW